MRKISRIFIYFLIFCLFFITGNTSVKAASTHEIVTSNVVVSGGVSVLIDGQRQAYGYQATLENGRTLVPVRGIFETLGASVKWNQANQTIEAQKGKTKIWLKIGSKQATVNGKAVTLSVPAKLNDGRTLVPLRFVSEALGEQVVWDSSLRAIFIGKIPVLGKPNSSIPKEAVVIEKGVGYISYAYEKTLPGGGKIKKVSVSVSYTDMNTITVLLIGDNQRGESIIASKSSESNSLWFSFFGKEPTFSDEEISALHGMADQFLRLYES